MLLAVAVLAVGACTSTPALKPNGRVDVPARVTTGRVQAKVRLGNEVVVHLPPIARAGDEWAIIFDDPRFLRQLRPVTQGAAPEVSFLAINPGRRAIRLLALPPGAREATPTQGYDVLLTIE